MGYNTFPELHGCGQGYMGVDGLVQVQPYIGIHKCTSLHKVFMGMIRRTCSIKTIHIYCSILISRFSVYLLSLHLTERCTVGPNISKFFEKKVLVYN